MDGEKILVVDDDPHIAELLQINLRNRGYRTLQAADGLQAVALAEKEGPDLVILDIMIPSLDGFGVCRRLRENEATHLIPILVLSAKDRPVDKITGLKLGADDYMTKPFDMEELMARVEAMLRRTEQCLAANPLTGLPGNVSIMVEVTRRIRKKAEFAFLYLDLDNFKPYNDKYGYKRGDAVIKFTADLLRKCAAGHDFVGHIGGDDFILICGAAEAEILADKIIRGFDKGISAFYDAADAARGRIESQDRRGNPQSFPLMTASLGLVINDGQGDREYGKIVEIATELKKAAKSAEGEAGSRYFIDRRK